MQNYNFFQRVLHDLVLSNKLINKSLYEIEKIFFLKDNEIKYKKHIFITGLARSGTTSLLNFINQSDQYTSLKYKNMPFILSPNLSIFFNSKNVKKKERLHNDGIFYDNNSPEEFDEFFFNNSEEYIKEELLNYINLILVSEDKKKYLSKNNLNYKRINLIQSILPNSVFLIPLRDPLQHSFSLLNQHLHFSRLQKNDNFTRRYMKYLGHNEFGLDHIPWNKPLKFNQFNNLNYWLEQWSLFYESILNKYYSQKNCIFLIYENLTNPNYIKTLLQKLDLHQNQNLDLTHFKNSNKKKIRFDYDESLYKVALKVYNEFSKLNFQINR